jgi:hypothetical protein
MTKDGDLHPLLEILCVYKEILTAALESRLPINVSNLERNVQRLVREAIEPRTNIRTESLLYGTDIWTEPLLR